MKKMQRASVANFTHAYDAALLINTINALAVKGIYVSAVHDMYILHPMHLADFMAVLQSEFEYVTSHMRGTILAYCAALKKELGLSKAGKIQKSIDKMTTEQAIKLIASIELSISNYESARLNYTAGQLIQLK
jgi:DNA-directed RNA polymerase